MRAAAILAWVAGLGFGIPAAIGAVYFARHHEVWLLACMPTNGNGPFEDWGIPDSTGLQSAFVAVCAAEVALGVRLWRAPGPDPEPGPAAGRVDLLDGVRPSVRIRPRVRHGGAQPAAPSPNAADRYARTHSVTFIPVARRVEAASQLGSADPAVDRLAEQVGMAGVAGSLLDQV